MPNDFLAKLGPLQVAAGVAHLAALVWLQRGLSWLIRSCGVDRLSLITNQGVQRAILRAALTRLQFWVWLCGLYTLFAWYLEPVLLPYLQGSWFVTARATDVLSAFTVLALSSFLGRALYFTSAAASCAVWRPATRRTGRTLRRCFAPTFCRWDSRS